MELSALGFGIGAAVGMIGVYLIVKNFLPKYIQLELHLSVGTTICNEVKSLKILFLVRNLVASIATTSSTLSVVAICFDAMS